MKVFKPSFRLSFIGSATFWQTAEMSIKTFVIGAKSDLTSLGVVLQSFLGGGVGMAGTAQIISSGSSIVGDLAADINAVTVAAKEQADFGKMIAADFAKMAKDNQAELTRQGREGEKAAQKRAEALKAEKKAFEESVAEMMRYNYELAKMDELNRQAAAAMEAKMVAFGSTMQAGGNTEKLAAFTDSLQEQKYGLEETQNLVFALENSFIALGGAMASVWNTGSSGLDAFLGSITALAVKLIATNLAMSMSNAIVGGTNAGAATGPAAPITMPAFIAGLLGVVASSFAGITKMAHGGIVDKPTNVQVGEAGPEAIIPLHKLSSLTGGGNLTARISGRDLLIMLDREQSFKKRVYG